MEDEVVQYFIVNSELNMSVGKTAAQVAHVATLVTWDMSFANNFTESDHDYMLQYRKIDSRNNVKKFKEWLKFNQPKIILRGKQREMEKLIEQGWIPIHDLGRTEIPNGSLTCIGYHPEYKSTMKPIVKRFQLL